MQVIAAIAKERSLNRPSVSYGAENLYMHGPLEELTKQNLTKVWPHLLYNMDIVKPLGSPMALPLQLFRLRDTDAKAVVIRLCIICR